MSSETHANTKVVTTLPLFELESYIQNYTGRNAVDRLLFIADRCPALAVDALVLAIASLKHTAEVNRYEDAVDRLHAIAPHDPRATVDAAWVDEVTKATRSTGDKLELELKSYKNNLIKESIRMGNSELGDFYLSIGDLASASKFYSRQREYCTTHKHIEDMSMDMIRVAVYQQNWSQVETAMSRIDALPAKNADIDPYLKAVRGLWALAQGNFAVAASTFLTVPVESLTHAAFAAPKSRQKATYTITEFVTVNDVAVIIGLCSLASYGRNALKDLLDNNANCKEFLQSEAHIRTLLDAFVLFDYKSIFTALENHKADYLLDIWLADHVEKLFDRIRENCYTQYVRGYKRGYLDKMAARFGVGPDQVEKDLIALIESEKVPVRLDLENKYFLFKSADERADVYDHVMTIAQDFEHNGRLLLVNIGVLRGGLEINAKPESSGFELKKKVLM
ncbi:26S proteasome subunit RPN7-domain-containing protein [Lipomyces tetrasporus]|uniref:26S proteasome subunit RPN7-domain-containing protein n=1 Tax=Lipomyces tetrasporus TaxID=54092 RepID=A0AAD7VQA8_9ASCO|nr:26S proteasome subunit RPN7-domain-containing protein [Lipomyces tetrasporus]KAJ8098737.1 26S proteasome subunit RPN7-domain-containing protein [Lipomyces tetrasporus]